MGKDLSQIKGKGEKAPSLSHGLLGRWRKMEQGTCQSYAGFFEDAPCLVSDGFQRREKNRNKGGGDHLQLVGHEK